MTRLGVNLDHVATVRQARRALEPDPVRAAVLAELGGADQITIHLREDRRHIQDRDLELLRATVTTRLNLEMGMNEEIRKIAKHAPDDLGRILAFAITTSITLYALVNAGVTLGILPTTGLPMPFVSYGGSSIFFTSIAVGVLLNISMQTDLYPRLAGTPDSIRPIEPVRAAAAGRVS